MNLKPPADPFDTAQRVRGRFVNKSGKALTRGDVWRLLRTHQAAPWPESITAPRAETPLPRVTDGIRITPMGHATVLLQVAGLNIVTDPVWSDRAGPLPWLGVKRRCPPPLALDDLPPIDIVLLSHCHYDHLDRATLARLERRDRPRLVTGLKVGRITPCRNVSELDWWGRAALADDVSVTYVPAEHASARGPFDQNKSLWGGFVIGSPAGTIYFAGDTAFGTHFTAIRERFGSPDVSLLPIGAYLPRWFMSIVHMDPQQAVEAATILQSRVTLPIHYGVFHLADDGYHEPLHALREALAGSDLDVRVPDFGTAIHL
ncbi:MAG TPA: MBL fold metallo-hydrolase [Pseudolabrys sp.]|nr:MBL fold metallo-hydrolase [Pseudolabrys sp.]